MKLLTDSKRTYKLWMPLCAMLTAAATLHAQEMWDPAKFMGAENIQRGMTGHILTVVEDTKVEQLPIEILSVEKNSFPKGDLIWAVGKGDKFQHLGIVGGMSGSPAIIDGKIIGALAYGYTNSKDPIIGITPIKQMLSVWNRNMVPTPPGRKSVAPDTGAGAILPDMRMWTDAAAGAEAVDLLETPYEIPEDALKNAPQYDYLRGQTMRRLHVPVAVSGYSEAMAPFIEAAFGKRGMTVLQGAGSGNPANVDPNPPVVAGSTIGTEYLRGDYAMYGFGTLTYRDGDKILAYGHPSVGEGDTYLPLSSGTVHFVIPSRVRSSKVASGLQAVGTMTQDREPAIAGVVGKAPAYIPMTVVVKKEGTEDRVFNYELVDEWFYTGFAARTAAGVSLDTAEKYFGKYALSADVTIEFNDESGLRPLRKQNDFTGTTGPGFAAASMMSPISPILNSWYGEVAIKRVHLEVEYRDQRENAVIQKVRIGKRRVRPGEHVELAVTFRPFLESPVVKRYQVQIPESAPEGFAFLFIGDPSSHDFWERSRASLRYQATNLEQLVESLERGGGQRGIVISVVSARMGLAVNGEELPNIPTSMLNVMDTPQHRGGAGLTDGSIIMEERRETPFLANGSALMTFFIDAQAP